MSDFVGKRGMPAREVVDARWTANYAAAVYDRNPVYFDDRRAAPRIHPLYVSHLEWDAIGNIRGLLGLTEDEERRGVHSFNQTKFHATLDPGSQIESTATVVGVERRRSGGRLTLRCDTICEGRLAVTSYVSSIYRGVEVVGRDVPVNLNSTAVGPQRVLGRLKRTEQIEIPEHATYHFSECARDYGAIHTSLAEAQRAGLPGLILHGTGTFAYALSSIVNHEAEGDPTRIAGFSGRLGAMVCCPSTLELQAQVSGNTVRFVLWNEDRGAAISDGIVTIGSR